MQTSNIHLDTAIRIPVLEPLRRVNDALLDLIRGFTAEEWHKPTVHPDRNVKDLTAHLLQTTLNRVAIARDAYWLPAERISSIDDLIAVTQRNNREFMTAMRWVSPRILIELLEIYNREMVAVFEGLDPDGPGIGVAWAGEAVSANWFDIAREYTEKWHHQQQLRDATTRPCLYDSLLLAPVLETFARGLPFAYRSCRPNDGTHVAATITGAVALQWTLRRTGNRWSLWSGADPSAETSVSIPADTAWRVWTKGMKPAEARERMEVCGDGALAAPLTSFVAIMA